MTVEIHIGVEGTADRGRELQGVAGWLRDDEAFARHWRLKAEPAPGRAGGLGEFLVALSAGATLVALEEPLRALVGALTGWLRSRARLSGGDRAVVRLEVPGREPVLITESEIAAEGVPAVVDRIREELERDEAGGA